MHPYATNSEDRKLIPFFLAVLGILMSFGVNAVLHAFGTDVPWWAPPVDTMFFYGIVYWLFDNFVWRWRILHKIRMVTTSDLSGKWHATAIPTQSAGQSSGLGAPVDIEFEIRQTWQRLSVVGNAKQSKSASVSGSILGDDAASTLSYEYLNEPIASAPETMQIHRGSARLSLNADGTELVGEYYSGRGRQNFGTLHLTRVQH